MNFLFVMVKNREILASDKEAFAKILVWTYFTGRKFWPSDTNNFCLVHTWQDENRALSDDVIKIKYLKLWNLLGYFERTTS